MKEPTRTRIIDKTRERNESEFSELALGAFFYVGQAVYCKTDRGLDINALLFPPKGEALTASFRPNDKVTPYSETEIHVCR